MLRKQLDAVTESGVAYEVEESAPGLVCVAAAAERLLEAVRSGVPCTPVRDLIGSDDVVAAYAVQEYLTRARLSGGAIVVGRKFGLTSPAVSGTDGPRPA